MTTAERKSDLKLTTDLVPGPHWHYIDVIMTTVASQITSLAVVYSIVYSGTDERKHQSSASLALVRGIHRDRWIPRKRASNTENVPIWWRHHGKVWSVYNEDIEEKWSHYNGTGLYIDLISFFFIVGRFYPYHSGLRTGTDIIKKIYGWKYH